MNDTKSSAIKRPKLKVCGMKFQENILEIASLKPDYMGFIFYGKSPRNFENEIPEISSETKKTGVFVNASANFILEKASRYNLHAIQLHGEENPQFCTQLRTELKKIQETSEVEIIKVFSVNDEFDFEVLFPYEDEVDYFLFDTKGKNKGGNGIAFNWDILKAYPSEKPFFLSGGIGIEELVSIKSLIAEFRKKGKQDLLYAIDVNSKFEIEPGVKNMEVLAKFQKNLKFLSSDLLDFGG
ncbi:phosphoribosylanthranilate isomerase [Gillisia sp. Q332]|uniref:phosphoribosylanthranilate isomerase n=1 Tax=Gillisia xinjiangensis TaxID=3384765 RepID=UPI00391CECA5